VSSGQALPPTRRYAVIGNPVAHSRSPWIHARFGEQTGIALQYTLLQSRAEHFVHDVTTFFAQGGSGLNVTVPFKTQAYALAQQLSPRARMAQAVNTLWMQDGELHGCNTDGAGLVRDIVHHGASLKDARILLVGAGGAARGVLFPLLESGCAHLRIVNRTAANAAELATRARHILTARTDRSNACVDSIPAYADSPSACTDRLSAGALADAAGTPWDIVINASSSSLHGQAPALPEGIYAACAMAYDMMYGATPGPFLQQARRQGAARLVDGLGMLVRQAAESFRIWHGVHPDPEPVLAALRQDLQQHQAQGLQDPAQDPQNPSGSPG